MSAKIIYNCWQKNKLPKKIDRKMGEINFKYSSDYFASFYLIDEKVKKNSLFLRFF